MVSSHDTTENFGCTLSRLFIDTFLELWVIDRSQNRDWCRNHSLETTVRSSPLPTRESSLNHRVVTFIQI